MSRPWTRAAQTLTMVVTILTAVPPALAYNIRHFSIHTIINHDITRSLP